MEPGNPEHLKDQVHPWDDVGALSLRATAGDSLTQDYLPSCSARGATPEPFGGEFGLQYILLTISIYSLYLYNLYAISY